MTTRRQAKREVLRERLIDAAGRQVADRGLASLRARDVAAEAGCALGGIYTVFADLDDLILHVNARTLERMGRELVEAVGDRRAGDALKALARGYARFARENRNLWAALFDHRMADGGPSPDWLLARHAALAQHIVPPLAAIQPELSRADLDIRARSYFAAVHGIVSMSLQQRFLGLPDDRLEPELDAFVDVVAAGSGRKG